MRANDSRRPTAVMARPLLLTGVSPSVRHGGITDRNLNGITSHEWWNLQDNLEAGTWESVSLGWTASRNEKSRT